MIRRQITRDKETNEERDNENQGEIGSGREGYEEIGRDRER